MQNEIIEAKWGDDLMFPFHYLSQLPQKKGGNATAVCVKVFVNMKYEIKIFC